MKKIFLALLIVLCAFSFAACGSKDSTSPGDDSTSLELNKTEITVNVGETSQLTANKNVTWSTDKPSVASVTSSGLVKGESAGTAVITATAGNLSASCLVTVNGAGGDPDDGDDTPRVAPELTLISNATATYEVTATDNSKAYTLDYSVSGYPLPNVNVFCDKSAGFRRNGNKFTFDAAGVYTFTVEALNSEGKDEEQFVVTVTDKYGPSNTAASRSLFDYDFEGTTLPGGITPVAEGDSVLDWSEDGLLKGVVDANSKPAYAIHDFTTPLSGIVMYETRFQDNGSRRTHVWLNLMFLRDKGNSAVGSDIIALSARQGKLAYHNGSAWTNYQYNGSDVTILQNRWYTVRMIINFNTSRCETYFSSDGETNIYLGETGFRNPVVSGTRVPNRIRIGADVDETSFTFDYMKLKQLLPELTINEETGTVINYNNDPTYTLDYTAVNADSVGITCDKTTGFTRDGNELTFTASGTYVFTLEAVNAFGKSASKTITVTVGEGVLSAPDINLSSEANITYSIQSPENARTYTFDYSFSGFPIPNDVITCDKSTGYRRSGDHNGAKVIFDAGGVYTFTITATNSQGTATKDIVITVNDKFGAAETAGAIQLFDYDFSGTTKPDGNGYGDSVSDSGAALSYATEGKLTGNAGTSDSKGAYAYQDFDEALSGVVMYETRFKDDSGSSLSGRWINLMFILSKSNSSNTVVCLSARYGYLAYAVGTTWTNFQYNSSPVVIDQDTWYTLRAVVDFDNEKVYIYFTVGGDESNGEVYLGETAFRYAVSETRVPNRVRIGADTHDTAFTFDYMKMQQLTPGLTINKNNETVIDGDSYALDYTAVNADSVEITCDKEDKVTIEDDEVTFDETGTYVFTITAENGFGSVSKTITVIVAEAGMALAITSPENTKVNTAFGAYFLKYTTTGADDSPTMTLTSDEGERGTDWFWDETTGAITFAKGVASGSYVFTLKAENSEDSGDFDEQEFTVTVYDSVVLVNADFTAYTSGNSAEKLAADGLKSSSSNGGAITYGESGATFKNATAGTALIYKEFDLNVTGTIEIETTFKVTAAADSGIYHRIPFGFSDTGLTATNCTPAFAERGGKLHYHNGTAWTPVPGAVDIARDTEYTLRIIMDSATKKCEVYFEAGSYANTYLGEFTCRNAARTIKTICIGSDSTGADYTVSSFKIAAIGNPVITLDVSQETEITIADFEDGTPVDVTLAYTTNLSTESVSVTVSCDGDTGYLVDGDNKKITFSAAGVYTVTITATGNGGTDTKTITVTVTEAEETETE